MRKGVLLIGALAVGGILAVGVMSQPEPGAPPAAVAHDEPGHEHEHEHEVPIDPVVAETSPAVDAATEFATVFVDRPTTEPERAAWNAEMTRMASPDLAEGLHWAEAERLPDSTVLGSELVELGDVAAAVRVDLADGEAWIVTLEAAPEGWQVTDVRPVG